MSDELDIVDIFAWSVLKQENLCNNAPAELTKWFQNVQAVAELG